MIYVPFSTIQVVQSTVNFFMSHTKTAQGGQDYYPRGKERDSAYLYHVHSSGSSENERAALLIDYDS